MGMEELLQITNINDFLFCPRSLYFGNVFRRSLGNDGFQQVPQKVGLASHRAIDENTYSTRKDVLSGIMVYCEKYALLGRIDVYDGRTKTLMERKWAVSAIWEGFRMQIYAQYLALREMGYEVKFLKLHSKKDNRTYDIPIPLENDLIRLEEIISNMRSFDFSAPFEPNQKKCANCIYRELCDVYEPGDSIL